MRGVVANGVLTAQEPVRERYCIFWPNVVLAVREDYIRFCRIHVVDCIPAVCNVQIYAILLITVHNELGSG